MVHAEANGGRPFRASLERFCPFVDYCCFNLHYRSVCSFRPLTTCPQSVSLPAPAVARLSSLPGLARRSTPAGTRLWTSLGHDCEQWPRLQRGSSGRSGHDRRTSYFEKPNRVFVCLSVCLRCKCLIFTRSEYCRFEPCTAHRSSTAASARALCWMASRSQISDGHTDPPLQTNFHFREIPAFRHDRRYLSAEFLRIELDRHGLRLAHGRIEK